MSHEVLCVSENDLRVYLTPALKSSIKNLVQRRFGSEGPGRIKAMLAKTLRHPYLLDDKWYKAEWRYRQDRYKRCRKLLAQLAEGLDRGEVIQEGVAAIPEGGRLSRSKLEGRFIPPLDVAPGWLLIQLDRHPYGGGDKIVSQNWLYSSLGRRVILLRHAIQIDYVGCPYMVKFGDGPPQPPSTHLRDSFVRYVESEFGASWREQFMALLQVQHYPLAAPGDKVQNECVAVTGHDCRPIEKQKYEQRKRDCEKRYGPRPPHLPQFIVDHRTPPAVSFVPDPGSPGVPPPRPTIVLHMKPGV